MSLHERLASIPMPPFIAQLPRDARGYPIPKFVCIDADGKPDFRIASAGYLVRCVKYNQCWICGKRLRENKTFVVGPISWISRVSAEPPMHRACAQYAVQACPYLANPESHRVAKGIPEDILSQQRMTMPNPGFMALWDTSLYRLIRPGPGRMMFDIGEPTKVTVFHQGRKATALERAEAYLGGCKRLLETADAETAIISVKIMALRSAKHIAPELRILEEVDQL